MKRIGYIILISVICCSWSYAQNKTTLVQRMNDIKTQTDVYFWDQATYLDTDTAKRVATERLLIDVNNNRNEEARLSVDELMPHASYIHIDRGEKKQCFAYIRKNDALTIGIGSTVSASLSVDSHDSGSAEISPSQHSFVPDAFVQRIMGAKDFMNTYNLLKSFRAQGQILQFGKLRDVEDYSSLNLILFDMQSQQIITMLSPVTVSGKRINVVNGTEDALDNYPSQMTAVIWYIKK